MTGPVSDASSAHPVVVGVGGGIAAYKACELVRRLKGVGYEVQVIPTSSALRFVGRATWEALSGRQAPADLWENVDRVSHVDHGLAASAVMVAPATADLLARAAAGRADDLLTATLLSTRAPVIFAPAMHTEMWEHPATQGNVETLRKRGALVLRPDSGPLAGGDSGPGRLPEAASLAAVCRAAIERDGTGHDLLGMRVLISAGGTREPLDPVRFLGNRSSGRQGWALAAAAIARGAQVTLVAANVAMADPAAVDLVRVASAAGLRDAVLERAADADVIVMAAAVADFRPRHVAAEKLKKPEGTRDGHRLELQLEQTPDILAELGRGGASGSGRPFLVGFAAETVGDDISLVELAASKLTRKGADLIVANRVGAETPFGSDLNEVVIVGADGSTEPVPRATKIGIANAILDAVARRAGAAASGPGPDRG